MKTRFNGRGSFWTTCRWPCSRGKIPALWTAEKAGIRDRQDVSEVAPRGDFKFRLMYSEYLAGMQESEKDNDAKQKIHDRWLNDLADFLDEHPKFDEAIDASLQLAQEFEFAGKIEKATKWYQRVVKDFADAPAAARATARACGGWIWSARRSRWRGRRSQGARSTSNRTRARWSASYSGTPRTGNSLTTCRR